LFWNTTPGGIYKLPVTPSFTRTLIPVPVDGVTEPLTQAGAIAWFQGAFTQYRSHPDILGGRWAVYHPDPTVCATLALIVQRSGFKATVVSANQPMIPTDGVVVGTWAIVTGVNFQPPITALFDLGHIRMFRPSFPDLDATHIGAARHFVDGPQISSLAWSSPESAEQVAGRCGRVMAGTVFHHPLSGTGVMPGYQADVLVHLATDLPELGTQTGVRIALVRDTVYAPFSVFNWIHRVRTGGLTELEVVHASCALLLAPMVNGVSHAVTQMIHWRHADTMFQQAFQRLLSEPFAVARGAVWPPIVDVNLGNFVSSVGVATSIGTRTRIWRGRPPMHIGHIITATGLYPSVSPDPYCPNRQVGCAVCSAL